MTTKTSPSAASPPWWLILVCFYASGLTGLVYELLWLRRLSWIFGSTTYSITTVLSAFMAGLGIGSYLIGRRVDRKGTNNGFVTYAWLEIGIAAYALLSLPLFFAAENVYAFIARQADFQHGTLTLIKFVLSFPILAIPAGMMGGTLPALCRALVQHHQELHIRLSWLYGINTLGAASGTLAAGLFLVEHVGLRHSMWGAALLNALIGVAVLVTCRGSGSERSIPAASDHFTSQPIASDEEIPLRQHLTHPEVFYCVASVTLTGALSMSYEINWTRLLGLVTGSSTYAFTIVLSIFLIGIAMGSFIYARFARLRTPTAYHLSWLLSALAMWVTVTLFLIPQFPKALLYIAQWPGLHFSRILFVESVFSICLLLIPTLIFGAALPMALSIIGRQIGQVGRDVGGVYLVNTGAAIFGSVLTGFFLIPWLGTQNTLRAGLVINLIVATVGLIYFAPSTFRRYASVSCTGLTFIVALAYPTWPSVTFDSGLAYRLDRVEARSKLTFEQRLNRTPSRLLSRAEGVNATIAVRQFREGTSLLINGKPDASTFADMPTQSVLGIVAMLAHPKPQDVAIIGWGSGVTVYATTFFPSVARLHVFEIEKEVVAASRFFHSVNGAVENNPKVKIHYDDARSDLVVRDRTYDVIISEPSNPWMAGVSALFTQEFYQAAKKRIKRDGVFAQWLQLYRIDSVSVALVFRTVLKTFRYVEMWHSDAYDVILVASDSPITWSTERIASAYQADARLPLYMGSYGPGKDPQQFFGCYLLNRKHLEQMANKFPTEYMTEDQPLLEYRAVRHLYEKHHQHMQSFWRLKIKDNHVLPIITDAAPPIGTVISGGAQLSHGLKGLTEQIVQWGASKAPDDHYLQLQAARTAVRTKNNASVQQWLTMLPDTSPWREEKALVRARWELEQNQPGAALMSLQQMGTSRPVARAYTTMLAAMKAKDYQQAWQAVFELTTRWHDPNDMDARKLERHTVYQHINELISASGQHQLGLKLLSADDPSPAGQADRLVALFETQLRLGLSEAAAKTMDHLWQYQVIDERRIRQCAEVYSKINDFEKVQWCRKREQDLLETPSSPALY